MIQLDKTLQIIDVAQMQSVDKEAIETSVSGEVLMENAGRAVAKEIMERFTPRAAVVLAGPGNNGGDGFVIARHLQDAGWDVVVALLGKKADLKGDAALMAGRFTGKVQILSTKVLKDAALVVDALFGLGLDRPLKGKVKEVVEAVNVAKLPVVAVDIPSGIHGDTGAVMGAAVKASLTVTFERKKPGLVLLPGKEYAGEVVVKAIGIPRMMLGTLQPVCYENQPSLWLEHFPWPRVAGHKYSRGHAIITGGRLGKVGAAELAALAALRTAAGLVTVTCPAESYDTYLAKFTSIMVRKVVNAGTFATFLTEPHRDAVLIGPGAGVDARTKQMVLSTLAEHKPCVLDADALTVFADAPEELLKATRKSAAPVVMTPHHGEFKRLFGQVAEGNNLERAKQAAAISGAVVLLKGADTVIAGPDGVEIVNTQAPPWLATAGAGDVLAGMITGLLAAGMPELLAAAAASWIHGAAAAQFGVGLIAEDLPEMIPEVLQELWLQEAA